MNEPQLSAEMEKRFNDRFKTTLDVIGERPLFELLGLDLKHFLATALEEQKQEFINQKANQHDAMVRADEREKVIEEVKELIAYSSFEMTPGGRPMKRTCSVEEAMRQLEKDVAKLNQLKGTEWVGVFAPNGGHDPNNPYPLKRKE